jgi:uncharacterized membrane protein YoaK (UPF0700 family)
LLLLTVSTGVIDADSYLALDHVFTGNMTGNVLFIGFALVGVAGIPFLNNAVALLGFVAGTIVGGHGFRPSPCWRAAFSRWSSRRPGPSSECCPRQCCSC